MIQQPKYETPKQKPEKKSKLVELREQLAVEKQKLSNLTPSLKADLVKAGRERARSIQHTQGKAAKSVKPHDKVKKEAIAAAKERLKSAEGDAQADYDQVMNDAKRAREEYVKEARKEFEAECGVARKKFNEHSEVIFKTAIQDLELAEETHEGDVANLKCGEMEARREAIEEIDGLETQIKFEVSQQKKAINKKKGKSKPTEASA